eukprot:CAMPEP_0170558240 /NCGR_PEP_ID=MMETSP0211-20121228/33831_1 /TAXON_ID=311385 /ORGANISM="Pseudokeronopsis sp., Strain OXSARD2" /LENGTH=54 /DNA_ID=CAMNT_0010870011 /DNA_START=186 /DNA_END=350 /DNA_ORIENTATION=+
MPLVFFRTCTLTEKYRNYASADGSPMLSAMLNTTLFKCEKELSMTRAEATGSLA